MSQDHACLMFSQFLKIKRLSFNDVWALSELMFIKASIHPI